ncbi:MAG: DUF86 domain-containing protein [Planctomycetota bacterium]
MKDAHLIQKRLAFIQECVADIRRDAKVDQLDHDTVQRRFIEHTLQIAIQAMLDVAFAISADQVLGESADNRQVFERLCTAGWMTPALRDTCRHMVAFRNVVVHRYLQVDVRIVRSIVERDLDDLLAFVAAVHSRMGSR